MYSLLYLILYNSYVQVARGLAKPCPRATLGLGLFTAINPCHCDITTTYLRLLFTAMVESCHKPLCRTQGPLQLTILTSCVLSNS